MKNSNFFLSGLLFFLLIPSLHHAQLSDGSYAPDFVLPATDGGTYSLYEYLDDGKSVILDFSATWCPPCWSYHNGGDLEDVYNNLGPGGTDQAMVFMVEADGDTSEDCIYGLPTCTGGTLGDWTAGVNYPILNPNSSDADGVASDYNIGYWPTVYGVAPNGQIYEIGQVGSGTWESYLVGSFQMVLSDYEVLDNGCVYDIDLIPVGGDGDIDYQWSNGATSEDLFEVIPGDYWVTMTDENNFDFVLGPIEVNGFAPIDIYTVDESPVICYGESSGFIMTEALGGSGDFNYDWSTGDTGPDLVDLVADSYSLTVTDNTTGCTEEFVFFIDEPEEIEVETIIYDALCGNVGQVTFETDGGSPPFAFIFFDFTTPNHEVTLDPGYYFVTIEDSEGCQIVDEFEITEIAGPAVSANATGTVTCLTPAVVISSYGSSTGSQISYTWYDASTNIVGDEQDLMVTAGGTYSLVVYDADSGCSSSAMTTVAEDLTVPNLSVGYSNAITCLAPTAAITGTSTNPNISYQWSTSNGVIASGLTSATASVSTGGNYILTATDPSNGCSIAMEIVVPQDTTIPNSTISGNTSFCQGTSTTLCVPNDSLAVASWTIDGMPGVVGDCITVSSTSTVTVQVATSNNGCTSSQTVTTSQNNLPTASVIGDSSFCSGGAANICASLQAGETAQWVSNGMVLSNSECLSLVESLQGELIVTNSFGCSSSSPFSIEALSTPDANINGDLGFCDGGSSTLCVNQAANQTYQWYIDGQAASTGTCIDVTEVGEVSVEVTNVNGCFNSNAATIQTFDNPMATIAQASILDCDNPSSALNLTTDNPDNVISWISPDGVVYSQDEDISVSLGGLWTAIVTSPNGCISEATVEVEQDPDSFANPDFAQSNVDLEVSFQDASTGLNIASYSWDFGDGNTSSDQNPTHVYTEVGIYNVCLSVSNNCGANTRCKNVVAAFPIQVTGSVSNVTCHMGFDGSIGIQIEGGIPPYAIEWIGLGTGSGIDDLASGTYPVLITDAFGEVYESTYEITEPQAISIVADIENATNGASNGSIDLTTTGGNGDFTYSWDNGMTGANISGLDPGLYTVTAIDNMGCQSSATFEVLASTYVGEIEIINSWSISPNPVSDLQNYKISLNESADLLVEWIDIQGRVLISENLSGKEINITKDVSHLDVGIYFFKITVAGKSATQRFIKI